MRISFHQNLSIKIESSQNLEDENGNFVERLNYKIRADKFSKTTLSELSEVERFYGKFHKN